MKEKYLITHYLPLIVVMVAAVFGFYIFAYDKALKMSLVIASGASYFVWGLIHHFIHKDLSWEVAFEYLIICLFGVYAILILV